jgi:hypothetical protein
MIVISIETIVSRRSTIITFGRSFNQLAVAFGVAGKIFGECPPIQSADSRNHVYTRLIDQIYCVHVEAGSTNLL